MKQREFCFGIYQFIDIEIQATFSQVIGVSFRKLEKNTIRFVVLLSSLSTTLSTTDSAKYV